MKLAADITGEKGQFWANRTINKEIKYFTLDRDYLEIWLKMSSFLKIGEEMLFIFEDFEIRWITA